MQSIGKKLAIRISLALMAVMIFFGIVAGMLQQNWYQQQFSTMQNRIVQQLSLLLGGFLFDMDEEQLKNVALSFLKDQNILSIKILEQEDVIIYLATDPNTREILELPQEAPQYRNFDTRFTDIVYFDEVMGTLEVVFTRQFELTGKLRQTMSIIGVILILNLLATSAMAVFMAQKHVSAPLAETVQIAQKIAAGNLEAQLSTTVSQSNEIKHLLTAVHQMTDTLQEVVEDVQNVADTVAAGSRQMRSITAGLSDGASKQAAVAEEVSTSIDQMTANIRQNALNARQTEQIAVESADEARDTGDAVGNAVAAMKKIVKKISIVEEIAGQTHTLSLNATIEAAKAEDHGKGFAVVASEVRALAERSREAAKEINELTESGVDIAEEAGERLNRLVPNIRQTARLVQEISVSSSEQHTGAEQINASIQQLDKIIQYNVTTSEQLSLTAEHLDNQARELQRIMAFFKTQKTTTPASESAK